MTHQSTRRDAAWLARRRHAIGAVAVATVACVRRRRVRAGQGEIRIAHVYSKTGPLEAYAKQTQTGLMMGLEYATGGTMTVAGKQDRRDREGRPGQARRRQEPAGGGVRRRQGRHRGRARPRRASRWRMLPVAEEYKKILLVEPAVADSITGDKWNKYIFRTGRNARRTRSRNAVALDKDNVSIATLAQDYAFGRDGVKAFKEALQEGQDRARGIPAAEHHRLHRRRPAHLRRAEGQAGPQGHLHRLGRRRQPVQDRRPRPEALRHRDRHRRQHPAGDGRVQAVRRAWKARPTTTSASRRTRSTTGWSPSTTSSSSRRPTSSPPAA